MPKRIATACLHLASATALGSLFLAAPPVLAKAMGRKAPELIQIFPKGPDLETIDGRKFKLSDPAAFVDRFNAASRSILVDYDHMSAFDPVDGGSSKAAGWIKRLEIRNGEVWAVVEWTVTAAAAIEASEYLYISPEFLAHKVTGEVTGLNAAALVNRPAFQMTALARSKATTTNGDTTMLKAIAEALGLPADATEATILAAIAKQKSDHATELASARTPKPEQFMPRADYDAVLARAETAETKLSAQAAEARSKEVDAVIASAISAGKIAPASKEHYVALAATEAGFDQIKKLVETLPPVIENPSVTTEAVPGPDAKDPTFLAAAARHYQDEQRKLGHVITISEAVTFVASRA
jgi:phage I-like protein